MPLGDGKDLEHRKQLVTDCVKFVFLFCEVTKVSD